MEHIGSSSNAPSKGSPNASKGKSTEEEVFVNHGEIAWHQMRAEWVGDQSKRSQRPRRASLARVPEWFDDMFSSDSEDPFPQPIPLPVMVRIVCDKWHNLDLIESDDVFSFSGHRRPDPFAL